MRARKIDVNQPAIVKQLRQLPGISVAVTSMVGAGFPDLICGHKGQSFLIELKDGAKSKSRKKLTPDEQEFKDKWFGHYSVCESLDEILTAIKYRMA